MEASKVGRVHDLKCWPPFYADVESGAKTFELRKNDRDYQEGDVLRLREWTGTGYSGRECQRTVGYILRGAVAFGLRYGHVVMALTTGDSGALPNPQVAPPEEEK